jgi:hypothetical protein
VAREDRETVPGTLSAPDGGIAERPKGIGWKRSMLSLKLLQTKTSGSHAKAKVEIRFS